MQVLQSPNYDDNNSCWPLGEQPKILALSAEAFAREITVIEVAKFKAITREELLGCQWTGKDKLKIAPNIVACTIWFNQLNFWVQNEILAQEDVRLRAKVMGQVIHIADALVKLNNLSSAMALMSALQTHNLFRLTKTRRLLTARQNQIYAQLESLFSFLNNCESLRQKISTMSLPAIPHLGLYLTDLTYINTAFPREKGGKTSEVWRTKMNEVIDRIAHFQASSYDLTPSQAARDHLLSFSYVNDLRCYLEQDNLRLSERLEPPENQLNRSCSEVELHQSGLLGDDYVDLKFTSIESRIETLRPIDADPDWYNPSKSGLKSDRVNEKKCFEDVDEKEQHTTKGDQFGGNALLGKSQLAQDAFAVTVARCGLEQSACSARVVLEGAVLVRRSTVPAVENVRGRLISFVGAATSDARWRTVWAVITQAEAQPVARAGSLFLIMFPRRGGCTSCTDPRLHFDVSQCEIVRLDSRVTKVVASPSDPNSFHLSLDEETMQDRSRLQIHPLSTSSLAEQRTLSSPSKLRKSSTTSSKTSSRPTSVTGFIRALNCVRRPMQSQSDSCSAIDETSCRHSGAVRLWINCIEEALGT